MMTKARNPIPPLFFLQLLLGNISPSSSQVTCPSCGSMQVPYPLSTGPGCGDPDYSLRCNATDGKLFFDALNGSSYRVLSILPSAQRLVVQPSPWIPGQCVTEDMPTSEGLRLNQSLPFNVTASNTIFLFNCSPRLLISPLNCTPSSLCHRYLERSGRVDRRRVELCASGETPCCTFVAGGLPSAYKIRLHSSGCRAFRSILHMDLSKPPRRWEEGLEIQWTSPQEPVCRTQLDCAKGSTCSPFQQGVRRCLCNRGHRWDHALATCSRKDPHRSLPRTLKAAVGILAFFMLAMAAAAVTIRKSRKFSGAAARLARAREDLLKASTGGKSARMFGLKELKKATKGFSKERLLGSGGFGEVYKGVLEDGTLVAVKSAKVGSIKSNQQVLNEVGILSQVNHKHLVRLLGCCVDADQPLMVYEFVSNGTLHEHLHGNASPSPPTFLDWTSRVKIALQTAEALAYLHSSAHTPIYHRDVKSTNILLDEKLNAKVSDFGLSRLARPGLSHVSTCAQGTLGYLDPEYYRNYQLTDKSDVYSYGVVLLELLTSQRAIDFGRDQDDVNLAMFVQQRGVMEVVDGRLLEGEQAGGMVARSMEAFGELALACLRERKGERPSMKEAVQELECIAEMVREGRDGGAGN
ncbi:hypothetical protein ACLOJK_020926 [Asimina triloba]